MQDEEERKRRELKAARAAELESFYERERLAREILSEEREIRLMGKEEYRSRCAWQYATDVENALKSARLAKEKAAELARLRREDAIQRVEKKLTMERAARTAERRRRADEVIRQIQAEQLVLTGKAHPAGYEVDGDPHNVMLVIEAGQRIMSDLFECRQKHIEAIKRQMLVQQKIEVFRKQCDGVDNDIRRLRRAIRLIEINPVSY